MLGNTTVDTGLVAAAQAATTQPGEEGDIWGLVLLVVIIVIVISLVVWRRRARRAGYPGVHAYLRSAPRTDAEKREALDMTLRGAIICLLAALAPPLLILGVFPLYYGGRKLCMVWMGLEILDEPGQAHSELPGGHQSSEPTG
jgi:hypothetical protein